MITGSAILAVPFTSNRSAPALSITLTGIASTRSRNFALLHDLLPNSRDVARTMAFVVVGGNIFGMIAPIATGIVIGATGSYDWAFGIAGILLLVGATVVLTMARSPMTINRDASSAQVAV
jgi:dipeptide/tripeptide permease